MSKTPITLTADEIIKNRILQDVPEFNFEDWKAKEPMIYQVHIDTMEIYRSQSDLAKDEEIRLLKHNYAILHDSYKIAFDQNQSFLSNESLKDEEITRLKKDGESITESYQQLGKENAEQAEEIKRLKAESDYRTKAHEHRIELLEAERKKTKELESELVKVNNALRSCLSYVMVGDQQEGERILIHEIKAALYEIESSPTVKPEQTEPKEQQREFWDDEKQEYVQV